MLPTTRVSPVAGCGPAILILKLVMLQQEPRGLPRPRTLQGNHPLAASVQLTLVEPLTGDEM